MANVVLTSDAKKIKIVFNNTEPMVGIDHAYISRSQLIGIKVFDQGYMEVITGSQETWQVSKDGSANSLPIDSVDGTVPTDLEHLAELIAGLMEL